MVRQHFAFQLRPYVDRKGLSAVYLVITVNSERHFLPTGVKVEPQYWNAKGSDGAANWIKDKHSQAKVLNTQLLTLLHRANVIKLKSIQDGVSYTPKEYAELIYKVSDQQPPKDRKPKKNLPHKDFLSFCRHIVELRKNTIVESSLKIYKLVIRKLQEFVGADEIPWGKVNALFFMEFRSFLLQTKTKNITVNYYMAYINTYVKHAIEYGYLPNENILPKKLKVTSREEKDKLTLDQVHQIRDMELEANTPLWHARNIFIFQFYAAGTRSGDAMLTKWQQVKDGQVSIFQKKTAKWISVTITPPLQQVLDRYASDSASPDDYIFPYLSRKYDLTDLKQNSAAQAEIRIAQVGYNNCLKLIAEKLGIKIPLASHISRHSFAMIAMASGANTYAVSKALGHSNLNTTENYLSKNSPHIVDKLMREIDQ